MLNLGLSEVALMASLEASGEAPREFLNEEAKQKRRPKLAVMVGSGEKPMPHRL